MRPIHPPGFTLVELSVVLVIIGLLVGGIMVGRDMIQAAQMRATITEFEEYKTRIYAFKLKYEYLPGDLPNATTLFGAAALSGNGDGQITTGTESLRGWQHMYLAGYIPYPMTGVLEPIQPRTRLYINAPPSKYSVDALFWLAYEDTGTSYWANLLVANYLELTQQPSSTYPAINSGTMPIDAKQIDTKMDDGMPFGGMLRAQTYTQCVDIPAAVYRTTSATPYCRLFYRLD